MKSSGADPNVHPSYQFLSANDIVAQNADCGNCDAAQYTYEGVRVDGIDWFNQIYRDHEFPSVAKDGHYIRLVMGCGNSISSITPEDAMVKQGGFGGNILDYRDNGIQIYAQIANCTFYDANTSEGLRFGRVDDGVSGTPPCHGPTCISRNHLEMIILQTLRKEEVMKESILLLEGVWMLKEAAEIKDLVQE